MTVACWRLEISRSGRATLFMTPYTMKLPPLYCPFPAEIHLDVDQVTQPAVAWMEKFALCASSAERVQLANCGFNRVAANLFPHAPRDRLQWTADFLLWLIAFDDEYCDEGPLSRQPGQLAGVAACILRNIETPEQAFDDSDRYAASLRDLRLRLDAFATPAQVRRWVEEIRNWFLHAVWKAGNVVRGITPSLNDFMALRIYDGGSMVMPTLFPVADGYELSASLIEDRRLRALTEMSSLVAIWDNDIFSYAKEQVRAPDRHNALDVIRNAHDCTVDQAVMRAVAVRDRIVCLFLRVQKTVTLDATPELKRYLASLGLQIRSSAAWCQDSERYTHPSGPAALPLFYPGGWADAPADDSSTPLPIPAIAWWWQYDPARTASAPEIIPRQDLQENLIET